MKLSFLLQKIICCTVMAGTVYLMVTLWPASVIAEPQIEIPPPFDQQKVKKISPLIHLQQFVSRADGNRCSMYPSCSHYARQSFQQYGLFIGWILTCDRLIRCGRDEIKYSPPAWINGQPHVYDPVEANTFWWDKQ